METKWSLRLIRLAAIFGLVGAVLGSHMAGSGGYQFRPVHAHILVVGWLSVFAWGIFYRVFKIKSSKLVSIHGWTTVIGSIGLTAGMWLNAMMDSTFVLVFYIAGGSILLISFGIFIVTTFMIDTKEGS
ncbi:hypothetical protein D1B31_19475 [Neobacillus notoginsengisoli]|uniref:Cytochrome-c oxidase n=1 Tax=Neobacillus notoginsengisoli TaxID=1578198 RepID=A0A417YN15_9BACI|nr:hypothetical protein [Neobacillus notoginsengisoli]RHW34847.1 hypothetical protein D1B31_19475 [Neobacillus notoginsengisoli]